MTYDSREASELMSLAVHEARTPANVIGGYLRMVLRDHESPVTDRQREMLEASQKSCARVAEVLAELSEFAKLYRGELTLTQQPLDLFTLVADVASGVHEAEDRGVRLELRGESAGAPIVGDSKRLSAALTAIFRAILREQTTTTTVVADRRHHRSGDDRVAMVVVAAADSVQQAYEAEAERFNEFDLRRGGLGLGLPLARLSIEGAGGRLCAPAGWLAGDPRRSAAVIALPITE